MVTVAAAVVTTTDRVTMIAVMTAVTTTGVVGNMTGTARAATEPSATDAPVPGALGLVVGAARAVLHPRARCLFVILPLKRQLISALLIWKIHQHSAPSSDHTYGTLPPTHARCALGGGVAVEQ